MILKQLSLTNYKNIASTSLHFSDKLNCIIGSNGMGKTNLLDSIYYLSFTRTNQYLPDNMVIQHGADMAVVSGLYNIKGTKEELFFGLQRGKNKTLKRNKKEYTKMSDHVGLFPLVMIAPSDIDLIKGGSPERRRFVDQILCQESRIYMTIAQQYKTLLEQRNSLLKQEIGLDRSLLSIIDQQMAPLAVDMIRYRIDWLERLKPIFLYNYQYITDDSEEVDLRYISSIGSQTPTAEDFISTWETTFPQDYACGFTRIGPHRDDLEMLLGEHLIRRIGSQGQNKSFMVALKLAQYSMLCELHPRNLPILLLDDVFDKLDEDRVQRIVQLVSTEKFGQIFMSDTNRKYLDQLLQRLPEGNYSIFKAQDGHFQDIT